MSYTPYFGLATNLPQASAGALNHWWAPDLGLIPKGGYCGFKVRVHDTKITAFKFDLLPLAAGKAPEIPGLVVDLTDIGKAWPGQSSAIHACLLNPCSLHPDPTQYGFLLLSKQYLAKQGIDNVSLYADDPDGKGKWPFGTDVWLPLLARFIEENAADLGPEVTGISSMLVAKIKSRLNAAR